MIATNVSCLHELTPEAAKMGVVVITPCMGTCLLSVYANSKHLSPVQPLTCSHAKMCSLLLQASLLGLFCEAGFACADFQIHERQIENRKQQVVMHRRWVQAKFVYSHSQLPASVLGSAMNKQADAQQAHTQQASAQQANTQQANTQQANIQQASAQQADMHQAYTPQADAQQAHTQQVNMPGLVLQHPYTMQPCAVDHETRRDDIPSASCQHSCDMIGLHDSDSWQATQHRQQPHNNACLHDTPKYRQCSEGSSCVSSPWLSDDQLPHDRQRHQATEQIMQQQVSSGGQYSPSCGSTVKAKTTNAQYQQRTRQGLYQEWEQGGSTPDVEQLTGGLFNNEQLEEVCAHHNLLVSVPLFPTAKPHNMLL